MKIITILGARPQFIKAAVVSKILNDNKYINEVIIHTGQHYDKNMSDVFFDELKIRKPDYYLNINRMNHGEMTGLMLSKIEKILINEKPDAILVYGDTNSTLAGSLAAVKLNIPIFHVESGMRSNNKSMPEEINRILTDHISSRLFCSSKKSIGILAKEGIRDGVIFTGDVMYDLFLSYKKVNHYIDEPFVLATIHRPSNTDNPKILKSIFRGLEKINKNTKIILSVHPRTEKKIKNYGIEPKISLIPPLNYKQMIDKIINAALIITDSGGLQKEAYYGQTKCITVRKETEWVELIENGSNILCDHTEEAIFNSYKIMQKRKCDFTAEFYGNGKAGEKIVKSILEFLC